MFVAAEGIEPSVEAYETPALPFGYTAPTTVQPLSSTLLLSLFSCESRPYPLYGAEVPIDFSSRLRCGGGI